MDILQYQQQKQAAEAARKEIANLKAAIRLLHSHILELKERLDIQDQRLDNLEVDLTKLQIDYKTLKKQLDNLETQTDTDNKSINTPETLDQLSLFDPHEGWSD